MAEEDVSVVDAVAAAAAFFDARGSSRAAAPPISAAVAAGTDNDSSMSVGASTRSLSTGASTPISTHDARVVAAHDDSASSAAPPAVTAAAAPHPPPQSPKSAAPPPPPAQGGGVTLKATVYNTARAGSPSAGGGMETTKLYSFLSSGVAAHAIEQVDGDDDLDGTERVTGQDPVPRSRLDMDFEHASVEDDLDDDGESVLNGVPRPRYSVAGMDGPALRGRCVDEINERTATAMDVVHGLPATPASVLEHGGRTDVVARIRPQTALELSEGGEYCMQVGEDGTTITVCGQAGLNRDTSYVLHSVLPPDASQEDVYVRVAHPIVEGVLYGYNGTILAYGQTGAGKTYTQFGSHSDGAHHDGTELVEGLSGDDEHVGIIPRAVRTLFGALRTLPPDVHVDVTVSMVEIYQDKIRDLLVPRTSNAAGVARSRATSPTAAFGSSVASSAADWVANAHAAASTVMLPVPGVSPASALSPRASSPRRGMSFHTSTLAVLPTGSQAAAAAAALGHTPSMRSMSPSMARLPSFQVSDVSTPERATSPRGRSQQPAGSGPDAYAASTRGSPRFTPLRAPAAVAAARTYGEEDPDNLSLVVDPAFGVQLCGAMSLTVKTELQVLDVLRIGAQNRAVAATGMNEVSSRSHCIITVTILQESAYGVRAEDGTEATAPPVGSKAVRYSKLHFVDLAGSERPTKSRVTGVQLLEAQSINSSLSTLGSVINALANGDTHIPYRDTKLTRLLQDGLGNNSRTALIINVSPSSYNAEESKSSLRFGATAVRVRTRATANLLNPMMLARKETLSRLQRAKSYSTYLRESQTDTRARDRAKRATITAQKMSQLKMTSPEAAEATPAPSNLVVPEATPASQGGSVSGGASTYGDDSASVMDGGTSVDGRSRSPRASRTSPDALRALLKHPSAGMLLGPAAHHFLTELASKYSAEEADARRAQEDAARAAEMHKAQVAAAAAGMQTYTEDAYGMPITVQVGPAVTQGGDTASSGHGDASAGGSRVLRRAPSGGDVVSAADMARTVRASSFGSSRGPLPTIADADDEDDDVGGTAHSSAVEIRSRSPTSGSPARGSPQTGSAGRLARASSSGALSTRSGAASMPSPPPVLRVLAPCEVYTVTLTSAPLGFRFFEPETAAHILPLLPPLGRVKLPVSTVALSSSTSSLASTGSMGTDAKPINAASTLPVVETVLLGFPADVLVADATGAVAFAEQFLTSGSGGEEDADLSASGMSEERAKGWESRGAIAIGDRLLAVNGIRLDLQPVSASAPDQGGGGDAILSTQYAEATKRAVKLVKFAMQSLKKPSSSESRDRVPSGPGSEELAQEAALDEAALEAAPAAACVLTFISAGPYVRKGIMVGLRLALNHEKHLMSVHQRMMEAAPQLPLRAAEAAPTVVAEAVEAAMPPSAGLSGSGVAAASAESPVRLQARPDVHASPGGSPAGGPPPTPPVAVKPTPKPIVEAPAARTVEEVPAGSCGCFGGTKPARTAAVAVQRR